MANIKITLTKSPIGRKPVQRKTVVALGLGRMGSSVIKEDTEANRAMAASIAHLVTVEETSEERAAKPAKAAKTASTSEKPSAANKVAEIKAYLDANNIEYPSTAKKAELLALVK